MRVPGAGASGERSGRTASAGGVVGVAMGPFTAPTLPVGSFPGQARIRPGNRAPGGRRGVRSAHNGGMYEERLTVPRSWWLLSVALGLSLALILLRFSGVGALVGLVVGVAAGAAALSGYGSARIRVVQGSLVAGPARIPVEALGAAEVLGPKE